MHRVEGYKQKKSLQENDLLDIKKKLSNILIIRLAVFALMVLGAIFLWPVSAFAGIGIIILGLATFLRLVKYNESLKFQRDFIKLKIELLEGEIAAQAHDYAFFKDGKHYHEIEHAYGYDLDLFGHNSFYQSVSRTATESGADKLAAYLKDDQQDDINLEQKQAVVKELADHDDFRQDLFVYGEIYGTRQGELAYLSSWNADFKPLVSVNVFWKLCLVLIPLISFGAITANILGYMSVTQTVFAILGALALVAVNVKHTNAIHNDASERQKILNKAKEFLNRIESEEFKNPILEDRKSKLGSEGWQSTDILKLNAIINTLDNRLNPMGGLLLNAFLAWDYWCLLRLEKWMKSYGGNFEVLFDQLAWWDVYASLGTYAYNHPNYVYPIKDDQVLKANNLGHPFLNESVCVRNDFEIDSVGNFVIVTGANMAGKSTFLRTVGLSLVMAKVGLPVYADNFSYKDMKLYTSMRTTDSLQDNESYFYTELKRLKGLVTRLEQGQEIFVILDEILKGTNSKDKAEGSKRFVSKLLEYKISGIIATHDLSLTSLGNDLEQVKNICFEVEFGESDLIFDYKLKPGVCKNMNATWLLEKMELV